MAKHYYSNAPRKINYLRWDMLGLLVTSCFPLANSQILLLDGTSSLLLGALASRTGSNSSIY